MQARETKQGAFIRDHFGSIWPVHLEGFTRLLVQLRNQVDGDLDLVLVLAVIGSRTQAGQWSPSLVDLERMTHESDPDANRFPINIQSVADFSGIPRETVRRKVKTLQAKGWVTRAADGRLATTRRAAEDLHGATGSTIAYLASLLVAFEAVQTTDAERD